MNKSDSFNKLLKEAFHITDNEKMIIAVGEDLWSISRKEVRMVGGDQQGRLATKKKAIAARKRLSEILTGK